MSAALRSVPPAASSPTPTRPKTLSLRAKGVPRSLHPLRKDPRTKGAMELLESCEKHGISNAEIAEAFGSKNEVIGIRIKSGAVAVSLREHIDRMPLSVVLDTVVAALLDRLSRERVVDARSARGQLVALHVEALRALLSYR